MKQLISDRSVGLVMSRSRAEEFKVKEADPLERDKPDELLTSQTWFLLHRTHKQAKFRIENRNFCEAWNLMKREHLTILLVDDEPDDLFFIERAFRAAGIKDPIRTVGSGEEALEYLRGTGKFTDRSQFEFPSFILTDLKMNHGDGFWVLETVRKNPEWAVIPIAILSGSADEDDIKKAYLLGATSYMTKPQQQGTLEDMLRKFHAYWTTIEVPRINAAGEMLETQSHGKIGERFNSF
jgi:CheY-like chemotaxis protein